MTFDGISPLFTAASPIAAADLLMTSTDFGAMAAGLVSMEANLRPPSDFAAPLKMDPELDQFVEAAGAFVNAVEGRDAAFIGEAREAAAEALRMLKPRTWYRATMSFFEGSSLREKAGKGRLAAEQSPAMPKDEPLPKLAGKGSDGATGRVDWTRFAGLSDKVPVQGAFGWQGSRPLGDHLMRRGGELTSSNMLEGAFSLYREAATIYEAVMNSGKANEAYESAAGVLIEMGEASQMRGDWRKASNAHREAIDWLAKALDGCADLGDDRVVERENAVDRVMKAVFSACQSLRRELNNEISELELDGSSQRGLFSAQTNALEALQNMADVFGRSFEYSRGSLASFGDKTFVRQGVTDRDSLLFRALTGGPRVLSDDGEVLKDFGVLTAFPVRWLIMVFSGQICAEGLRSKGDLQLDMGRYEDAIKTYEKADSVLGVVTGVFESVDVFGDTRDRKNLARSRTARGVVLENMSRAFLCLGKHSRWIETLAAAIGTFGDSLIDYSLTGAGNKAADYARRQKELLKAGVAGALNIGRTDFAVDILSRVAAMERARFERNRAELKAWKGSIMESGFDLAMSLAGDVAGFSETALADILNI